MSSAALKLELHELIDKIEDETKLVRLLESIKWPEEQETVSLWDKLTPEQLAEIDASIEESKDRSKRIPHEVVLERFKEWL